MQLYRPERLEKVDPGARPLAVNRPHFGRYQVRTLRGIKFGIRYKMMKGAEERETVIITKEPYQDQEGGWWFDYIISGSGIVHTASCSDSGVTAYDSGRWNPVHWLART